MALCRQRYSASAFDVNGVIALCGCLGQNADEVDDRIRSRGRTADACVVKYIALGYLRCIGRFSWYLNTAGIAHDHTHRRATSTKQRHQVAADKSGSAKHRDAADHASSPFTDQRSPTRCIIVLDQRYSKAPSIIVVYWIIF